MCTCAAKPLTTRELAERWGTTPAALAQLRYEGKPLPRGFQIGRRWLYRLGDIEKYESERMR